MSDPVADLRAANCRQQAAEAGQQEGCGGRRGDIQRRRQPETGHRIPEQTPSAAAEGVAAHECGGGPLHCRRAPTPGLLPGHTAHYWGTNRDSTHQRCATSCNVKHSSAVTSTCCTQPGINWFISRDPAAGITVEKALCSIRAGISLVLPCLQARAQQQQQPMTADPLQSADFLRAFAPNYARELAAASKSFSQQACRVSATSWTAFLQLYCSQDATGLAWRDLSWPTHYTSA